jgi:excisionase family DNA binding protein
MMKTATPLLVSLEEAAFQLSISKDEVGALIRERELTAVKVCDKVLVAYDSLLAFTRRVKRNNTVSEVSRDSRRAAAIAGATA